MRPIVLGILALAVFSLNLMAVPLPSDLKPIPEPTAEQLAAAKEAYETFGADYEFQIDTVTKQTFHVFKMPSETIDEDLKGLPKLPFGFGLSFMITKVTDARLKELNELNVRGHLIWVDPNLTKITDSGLKELKDLKNLTWLDLSGTKITDAGLKELKGLKNLTNLNVRRTQVTDDGVKELQEALPKCKIVK